MMKMAQALRGAVGRMPTAAPPQRETIGPRYPSTAPRKVTRAYMANGGMVSPNGCSDNAYGGGRKHYGK
jgi:hypothetical protein